MAVLNKEEKELITLGEVSLASMVESFCSQNLIDLWKNEIKKTFEVAKELDDKAKSKGAGKADNKKKPKKGAEEKPAGLQLGKGSR